MEYSQPKFPLSDTCESFTQRRPLQEISTSSLSTHSEIQDKLSILTRKKNQMKELKLLQANYREKGQEQESRIEEFKIEMDHQLEVQENLQAKIAKVSQQISWHKTGIRQLQKELQESSRSQNPPTLVIENLRRKIVNSRRCGEQSQQAIIQREEQRFYLESQLACIDQVILKSENLLREKQEYLTSLQLEETQLKSQLQYLNQRAIEVLKTRNKMTGQNKTLDYKLKTSQNKLYSMSKEMREMEWNNEQILKKNLEIDEINTKLLDDLEAVRRHLGTLQKTNRLLSSSLQEYEMTGHKISRLIVTTRQEY